jgi:hypothetical protein
VVCGAITPDPALDSWLRRTWRLPQRNTEWEPSSRGLPARTAPAGPVNPGGPDLPAPASDNVTAKPGTAPAPGAPKARGVRAKREPAYVAASQWQPDDHQQQWEEALAALLLKYRAVLSAQRTDLVDQVVAALEAGKTAGLALSPPGTAHGPDLVAEAMQSTAMRAAEAMIAEAAAQGVTIDLANVAVDAEAMAGVASARTSVAASYMAQQASSKVLQVYDPTPSGFLAAADEVDKFLSGLSNRTLSDQLGAALTAAQNAGRIAVLEAAPEVAGPATYVAAEFLDVNTCENCRKEDGHEFDSLAAAEAAYPTGGFKDCQGLMRCRGTVVAVWGD